MTFEQFLDGLEKATDTQIMELSPGPFSITVGDCDARAATILKKLDKKMKPETKLGDAESTLVWAALNAMADATENRDVEEWTSDTWYTDETRAYLYAWWWLVFWASQVKEETEKEK